MVLVIPSAPHTDRFIIPLAGASGAIASIAIARADSWVAPHGLLFLIVGRFIVN